MHVFASICILFSYVISFKTMYINVDHIVCLQIKLQVDSLLDFMFSRQIIHRGKETITSKGLLFLLFLILIFCYTML